VRGEGSFAQPQKPPGGVWASELGYSWGHLSACASRHARAQVRSAPAALCATPPAVAARPSARRTQHSLLAPPSLRHCAAGRVTHMEGADVRRLQLPQDERLGLVLAVRAGGHQWGRGCVRRCRACARACVHLGADGQGTLRLSAGRAPPRPARWVVVVVVVTVLLLLLLSVRLQGWAGRKGHHHMCDPRQGVTGEERDHTTLRGIHPLSHCRRKRRAPHAGSTRIGGDGGRAGGSSLCVTPIAAYCKPLPRSPVQVEAPRLAVVAGHGRGAGLPRHVLGHLRHGGGGV